MSANILIMDEEPGIRDLLSRELTAQGYRADSAKDGVEGLEKLGHDKYQVVLCDINMPKLGGLGALEEIRKRAPEIEVIMMTGYASVETAVDAMKMGAYDFVQKPFNRKDVETICGQSQRCRVIIQNLLQFSRRKEPLSEPVDLAPLIKATVDLVNYDFSTSGIELLQHVPTSFPMVFADPNQLQQVFLNLITNARQAFEGRKQGKLTIEGEEQKGRVLLHFIDDGPGIPAAILG